MQFSELFDDFRRRKAENNSGTFLSKGPIWQLPTCEKLISPEMTQPSNWLEPRNFYRFNPNRWDFQDQDPHPYATERCV